MTSYFVFSSLHSAIVPAQGDHAAALSGSCGAGLRPAPLQYLWMGPRHWSKGADGRLSCPGAPAGRCAISAAPPAATLGCTFCK